MWWIEEKRNPDTQRQRIRATMAVRESFRQLNLTDDQMAANADLCQDAGCLQFENERLIADIQALENMVRTGRACRQREQAETLRLQSECDRWLSETQMLSQRLTEEIG